MKYISKSTLSGRFIYDYINLLPNFLDSLKEDKTKFSYEYFNKIKNDIINAKEISELLDFNSQEDFFDIGDMILFDKDVLHRSVRLEEGPIDTRLAFALRFISTQSHYDLNRVKKLKYAKDNFDYQGSSDFNEIVCKNDNEKIIDSWMFKKDRDKRIIF
jgi:hypothetical protein